MAQFKLLLLNLKNNDIEKPSFLYQIISEFNNTVEIKKSNNIQDSLRSYQINNNSFCYTFNEKFKEGLNSQKTLTFSMLKTITREDRTEDNPFIPYLVIGAQILLIDKYDNHHLFTINQISFNFHQNNLIYDYECQDSFTYQLSRQNDGYEIKNDISDDNFIGAHSIDWWTIKKIQKDCHISYTYLPLQKTLKVPYSDSTWKTIKLGFNKERDKNLFKTISFAGSGTANSLLINLAEQYGLQLKVYEHLFLEDINIGQIYYKQGELLKYYWFELSKKPIYTGLKYSPYHDIKTFGLSHSGNALTTVLNVQSHEVGNELISLLPSVPIFFKQYFETDEWNQSNYYEGIYSNIMTHKKWRLSSDNRWVQFTTDKREKIEYYQKAECFIEEEVINNQRFLFFPIYSPNQKNLEIDKFIKPQFYNHIRFSNLEENSKIYVNLPAEQVEVIKSNVYSWSVIFEVNNIEKIWLPDITDIKEDEALNYIFIKIPINDKSILGVRNYEINIDFYRETTPEEEEFAKIADQCPWLENKLIDFSYFLNNHILTTKQNTQLTNLIYNNLRIANGKTLLYAQNYYQALIEKTKTMSEIEKKIDKLGAVFQADILDPYTKKGRAKETNNFLDNLNNLLKKMDKIEFIAGYGETLSKYVFNYINAEQNFLKNIYLFSNFFNEANNTQITIDDYKISLPYEKDQQIVNKWINVEENNKKYEYYYAFNSLSYKKILQADTNFDKWDNNIKSETYGKPNIALYHRYGNDLNYTYSLIPSEQIVWKEKFDSGKLYVLKNPLKVKEAHNYDFNTVYFEKCFICSTPGYYDSIGGIISWDNSPKLWEALSILIKEKGFLRGEGKFQSYILKFYDEDKKEFILLHEYHKGLINSPLDQTNNDFCHFKIQEKDFILIVDDTKRIKYEPLSNQDIILGYLFNQKEKKLSERPQWYTPNYNNYQTIDWPSSWTLPALNSWLLKQAAAKNWVDIDQIQEKDIAFDHYKECFPIYNIYFKYTETEKNEIIEKYALVDFVNNTNYLQFYRPIEVTEEERQRFISQFCNASNDTSSSLDKIVDIYQNNILTFGNTGWTTKDIFNKTLPEPFQGYYDSERYIYTKDIDSYKILNDKTSIEWDKDIATHILNTYSSLPKGKESQFVYKPVWWRVYDLNSTLNKNDNYKILLLTPAEKEAIASQIINGKINAVINYFLSVNMTDLNLKDMTTNTFSTKKLFSTAAESDGSFIKYKNVFLLILKEENYNRYSFSDLCEESKYELIQATQMKWYDAATDQLINFYDKNQIPNLCEGYFVSEEDNNYINTTEDYYEDPQDHQVKLKPFDLKQKYFIKDKAFLPLYSIYDLMNNPDIYECDSFEKRIQTLDKNKEKSITINIFKREKINESYGKSSLVESQEVIIQTIPTITSQEIMLKGYNIPVNLEIKQEHTESYSAKNNGNWWFKYHNSPIDLLREETISIENTLTEYWTNAYYASKQCKYFLPQTWTFEFNQLQNKFFDDIFDIITIDSTKIEKELVLNSKFIPLVYKTEPRKQYKFKLINTKETIENNENWINDLDSQPVENVSNIIKENNYLKDIFEYLNLKPEEWNGDLLTLTNYYQAVSGGYTWQDALKFFSGQQLNSTFFGGWNDLMIYILTNCGYQEYDNTLFIESKRHSDNIWKHIYTSYPNILLEKNYKDENALDSLQLLNSAQHAFLDYKKIERNYNISTIDFYSLKGYKGQELHIGDAIQINQEELYDGFDELANSLKQFLFISDMSYSLRKDEEISLTVNDLKYQDKVLTQLIKLIR